jgi:type VI secretion system protein ImpE
MDAAAAALLKEGRLAETLAKLQEQVRKEPAKAEHRVFLFQLLCLMGQWDRALTQLNVAADLNPANLLMAEVCRPALVCEALRREIFEGKRSPLLLGEPADWIGWLVQAVHLLASGKHKAAAELRARAFEEAPAVGGTLNGEPFEWIADADARLGPVMEAIIEGKYYWIPLSYVRQISMEPPQDLRDLVWSPALFTWVNGGAKVALIPTRYPGTERSDDDALRLARKTEWSDAGEETFVGLGQRMLATDAGEVPLLELRKLVIGDPMEADPSNAGA